MSDVNQPLRSACRLLQETVQLLQLPHELSRRHVSALVCEYLRVRACTWVSIMGKCMINGRSHDFPGVGKRIDMEPRGLIIMHFDYCRMMVVIVVRP